MKAGINLYSLRHQIETEESFLRTANALREMGYSSIQYSGAGYDPDMLARVSAASGLPVVLTHMPMQRILEDTDKLMEEHARFGCKNIGLGAMPMDILLDEVKCKGTIEKLNLAAERMQANGYAFFYHHHHFEFHRHGGEMIIEYMLKNAPAINFTADTYWMQFGGVSVLQFLERMAGRIGCVHLKDYGIVQYTNSKEKQDLKPDFVPVGEGNMDFVSIVAKMKELGAKHFLVEQDNATNKPDPMDEARRSINYITKEL